MSRVEISHEYKQNSDFFVILAPKKAWIYLAFPLQGVDLERCLL